MGMELQSKPGDYVYMSVETKLLKGLPSVRGVDDPSFTIASRILLLNPPKVSAKALQALPPWTLTVQIVMLYRTCKSLNTERAGPSLNTFPQKRREAYTRLAKRLRALRKGFLTSKLARVSPKGGRRGNRERSAPATAAPPPSKVRHHSQLLPEQRHINLVEVKYCEDTQPKNQLEASKQQHRDL
eukprot:869825-Pelagomonas_calceolata.AAC.1